MKIIKKDNYGRENVSDFLVCSDVNEYYGNCYQNIRRFDRDHYRLAPGDYKLYEFWS